MGVALISVVMLRPSGTWMTISSARTVSPAPRGLHEGELPQRDDPPVGPPEGHHGEQLLR